jgi:hypothetical protein
LPKRSDRRAASRADALSERVDQFENAARLLVQHEVVVPEIGATHVPVKVLGLEVESQSVSRDLVDFRC